MVTFSPLRSFHTTNSSTQKCPSPTGTNFNKTNCLSLMTTNDDNTNIDNMIRQALSSSSSSSSPLGGGSVSAPTTPMRTLDDHGHDDIASVSVNTSVSKKSPFSSPPSFYRSMKSKFSRNHHKQSSNTSSSGNALSPSSSSSPLVAIGLSNSTSADQNENNNNQVVVVASTTSTMEDEMKELILPSIEMETPTTTTTDKGDHTSHISKLLPSKGTTPLRPTANSSQLVLTTPTTTTTTITQSTTPITTRTTVNSKSTPGHRAAPSLTGCSVLALQTTKHTSSDEAEKEKHHHVHLAPSLSGGCSVLAMTNTAASTSTAIKTNKTLKQKFRHGLKKRFSTSFDHDDDDDSDENDDEKKDEANDGDNHNHNDSTTTTAATTTSVPQPKRRQGRRNSFSDLVMQRFTTNTPGRRRRSSCCDDSNRHHNVIDNDDDIEEDIRIRFMIQEQDWTSLESYVSTEQGMEALKRQLLQQQDVLTPDADTVPMSPTKRRQSTMFSSNLLQLTLTLHPPVEFILLIKELQPDLITTLNKQGQTPLHIACAWGGASSEVLQTLIQWSPTQILALDQHGNTPMHLLCGVGWPYLQEEASMGELDLLMNVRIVFESCLDLLIGVCPQCVSIPNNQGITPLQYLPTMEASQWICRSLNHQVKQAQQTIAAKQLQQQTQQMQQCSTSPTETQIQPQIMKQSSPLTKEEQPLDVLTVQSV